MSEAPNKNNGEQQQHAYVGQPLAASPYQPMPGGYPPYYAYPPPPTDANGHGDPNGHPGVPPGAYMMPIPHPGMMYAYAGQGTCSTHFSCVSHSRYIVSSLSSYGLPSQRARSHRSITSETQTG